MNIAIVGTGNVGGALCTRLSGAGHSIILGVRDAGNFKGAALSQLPNVRIASVADAVAHSDVVILSTPAPAAAEVATSLGNTEGKVIIDTMNIVMGRGPEGFNNTSDAILGHTNTRDVVKCFNTTGFENMLNPMGMDMFVAGDSEKGKEIASGLAQDVGFGKVWDMGGNDRFFLTEQLANVWINLAIFRQNGRNIRIKVEHT